MRRAASSRHVAESFLDRRNVVIRVIRIRVIVIDRSGSRNRTSFKGGNGWIEIFCVFFEHGFFSKFERKNFGTVIDGESIVGKRNAYKETHAKYNILHRIHRILRFFFKRYPSKNVIGVNVLWLSVEQSTALKIPLWREIRTRFTNPLICKEACVPFPWFKRVPRASYLHRYRVLTGLRFLKRFLSTQKILSSQLIKPARRFPPREPNDRSAFR